MKLAKSDVQKVVGRFMKERQPESRYASFDYCYNYFHPSNRKKENVERDCMTLGFYLASWGMMRGSSFLLQKSAKHLEKTVEYINDCDPGIWKIDANQYAGTRIDAILEMYDKIREAIVIDKHRHLVLVTKIMLGVFGIASAFDENFCETFGGIFEHRCGFRSFNRNSLECIGEFYQANADVVDSLAEEITTLDFASGKPTKLHYTKANIIDMYGFQQ